jgi:DDE superfamily endonuclease
MLLFQFPGIAERWLTQDDWANFRNWGPRPDADDVIADLETTGSLPPGLNWYRANIPPESWVAPPQVLPPVQAPTMGVWRTESRDPDRDAKLDRIEYVTSNYPDRCFAFDQFGPLSIRPCHGTCWAPRKHPVRLRATYHRTHGIRYFHGCYSLGDDQLWGVTREHKGGDHALAALKSIRAARPGGYRLFVIMDNLSANKAPAIRRWAQRENVELCFTPTSASWANPRRSSGPCAPLSWAARTTRTTPRWLAGSRTICDSATRTPATPTCWPPSAANEPASAANASNAGAARNLKLPNRAGERSWPTH